MSQVTPAVRTPHLSTNHAVAAIFNVFNRFVVLGFVETRPATVRVKLGIALKQKRVATATVKATRTVLLEKLTGVWPLGASLTKHMELEGR